MPDGTSVGVHCTFVWCASCCAVSWGECVADLDDLEQQLVDTEARHPLIWEDVAEEARIERLLSVSIREPKSEEELLALRIRHLRERIAWRRIRTSLPRCLECGSVDIIALSCSQTADEFDEWTMAEHPGCGGTISVTDQVVFALNRSWTKYSPDGEKLQET
jgi:hypothetical protein